MTKGHAMMQRKPLHVFRGEEKEPKLPQNFKLRDLVCYGIGTTVGSGIFATSGDIISRAAGPAAVLSWMLAGIVCCMNGFAFMELSSLIQSAGGTYSYAYHAIGELPAFIAASFLTLRYGLAPAVVTRSWADKVEQWLIELYPTRDFHWLNLPHANLLGGVIMLTGVLILSMGTRVGKYFVNGFTVTKILVVIFIIVSGFLYANWSNLTPFVPPQTTLSDGTHAFGLNGIILGASMAFMGYEGFDSVCCVAAEAKNARKIAPIAVITVVLCTMCFSVLSSLVLSGMAPLSLATGFSAAYLHVGHQWAATIVHLGETITMPVVVLMNFQARVNFALSCDGFLPPIFARVTKSGNLFWNTVMTGIFFTAGGIVMPFRQLWSLITFGVMGSFIVVNVSLLLIRLRPQSPVLAPRLVASLLIFSILSTTSFNLGAGLIGQIIGGIFLVGALLTCAAMYKYCPQEPRGTEARYWAPMVPLIPTLAIIANVHLSAEIGPKGLLMGSIWVGVVVLMYLVYGYSHSAARRGWNHVICDDVEPKVGSEAWYEAMGETSGSSVVHTSVTIVPGGEGSAHEKEDL